MRDRGAKGVRDSGVRGIETTLPHRASPWGVYPQPGKRRPPPMTDTARPPLPQKAAVIGAGLMGTGIAVILAQGVPDVSLMSRHQETLDRSRRRAERGADALHRHGLLQIDPQTLLGRLRFTTSLEEAAGGAGFVAESITEDPEVKREVFARLDALLPPPVVLSSNTSALPIEEFARG